MKKIITASFFLFATIVLSTPITHAADSIDSFGPKPEVGADGTIDTSNGFIPCSGTTCSPCDLVVLFNSVLKWFMGIAFLLFAVLAMKAGIGFVTSGGNPGALADAKKSFTNAFIGLIIILSAWLIVDTLMRNLLAGGTGDIQISNYGPWSQVSCAAGQSQAIINEGFYAGDPVYTPTQLAQSFGVPDPSTLSAASVSTKADCSPAKLSSMGMSAVQANTFSCIAEAESGCSNNPPPNPASSARGMFQITRGYNNTCHNLNLKECSAAVGVSGNLNCSRAFQNGKVKVGMEALAAQCNRAAENQACNVAAALCIYDTEGGYGAWLGLKSSPHPKQVACVAKYAK